jgi:hypothetical protein
MFVMPGLVPGIHVFLRFVSKQYVDGRESPATTSLKPFALAEFQDCLAAFVQTPICTRKRHKVSDI